MLDQTSKLSSVVAESLRCNSVVSGIANTVDSWIGTDGTESTDGIANSVDSRIGTNGTESTVGTEIG